MIFDFLWSLFDILWSCSEEYQEYEEEHHLAYQLSFSAFLK